MKKNQIILIIIGVLILLGFVSSFSYWFLYMKEREDLCAGFPEVEGEITCQEAREIALGEYPGEVYSVNKTETPPLLEGQDSTEKFWVVGINLDEPIEKELPAGSFSNKAEIFINIDTGVIGVLRLK